MRRLLYVPIVHSAADLGSVGALLEQRGALRSGARRWALHQDTVRAFWQSVAAFLRPFAPAQLAIYQDGLAAEGTVGRWIVEEAARRGSTNYQLVRELLATGAELRQTEDPLLLLQERENVLRLLQQESVPAGRPDVEQYRLQRDSLMHQRDALIAETITAGLKEGELGVLFMGADHEVVRRLPADIAVEAAKDPDQVRTYFMELLFGQDDRHLEALAQYLAAPIDASKSR